MWPFTRKRKPYENNEPLLYKQLPIPYYPIQEGCNLTFTSCSFNRAEIMDVIYIKNRNRQAYLNGEWLARR
jgi:hypothetical protein